jgi:hypothetical protein
VGTINGSGSTSSSNSGGSIGGSNTSSGSGTSGDSSSPSGNSNGDPRNGGLGNYGFAGSSGDNANTNQASDNSGTKNSSPKPNGFSPSDSSPNSNPSESDSTSTSGNESISNGPSSSGSTESTEPEGSRTNANDNTGNTTQPDGSSSSSPVSSSSSSIPNNVSGGVVNVAPNASSDDAYTGTTDSMSSGDRGSNNGSPLVGGISTTVNGDNPTHNGTGVTPGGGGEIQAANTDDSGGLHPGAIAGIAVVAALIMIGAVLFLVRRHHRNRRNERRNVWWRGFSDERSSMAGDDVYKHPNWSSSGDSEQAIWRATSSGAASRAEMPEVPAMAQIKSGNRLSGPSSPPSSPSPITPPSPLVLAGEDEVYRFSGGTTSSGFHPHSIVRLPARQLTVDTYASLPDDSMSVRPFSPSESFAFPTPPISAGLYQPSQRTLTTDLDDFLGSFPQPPMNTPANPFILEANPTIQNTRSNTIDSILTPASDEDFTGLSTPSLGSPFLNVEGIILRPFVPTLFDEISVQVGEVVKVTQVFDDGWAWVTKEGDTIAGLIPVDCLNDTDEDVPAFLAAKRVSSSLPKTYEATRATGQAM